MMKNFLCIMLIFPLGGIRIPPRITSCSISLPFTRPPASRFPSRCSFLHMGFSIPALRFLLPSMTHLRGFCCHCFPSPLASWRFPPSCSTLYFFRYLHPVIKIFCFHLPFPYHRSSAVASHCFSRISLCFFSILCLYVSSFLPAPVGAESYAPLYFHFYLCFTCS